MAGIEPLISLNELKTNLLARAKMRVLPPVVHYDRLSDTLILQIVPLDVETVVYYVDNQVGLIYQAADLEIVGIQVDDFERSFLPQHDKVQRVWKLRDSGVTLNNFGDMILRVEEAKPKVAREVVRAAEDLLGEPGAELAAAMA